MISDASEYALNSSVQCLMVASPYTFYQDIGRRTKHKSMNDELQSVLRWFYLTLLLSSPTPVHIRITMARNKTSGG